MKKRNINFDINATERPTKHVLSVLRRVYRQRYNNPSAAYFDAQMTAEAIKRAREQVAEALGCDAEEIIFTSGASESNSLVQANLILDVDKKSHHSLVRMDLVGFQKIKAIPLVVSETGECLINEIEANKNIKYFIDLTQAIGKVDVNLHNNPNIVLASASGHKFGGILGCGILYINKNFKHNMKPLIYGTQEKGLRGGTYNVPAIICFGEAIKEAEKNKYANNKKIEKIISYIYEKIKNTELNIKTNNNVINITFNSLLAATAVQIFDKYGINISAGSACSSGEEKPSEAYLASGYTADEALRTVRVSVGCNNTIREAKKFVKVLKKVIDNYDV